MGRAAEPYGEARHLIKHLGTQIHIFDNAFIDVSGYYRDSFIVFLIF